MLTPVYVSRVSPRPAPIGGSYFNDRRDDFSDDGTISEGDDEALWEQGPVDDDEADEAIHNREEELQVELQMTTVRLEGLKKTLKETKSVLGVKPGAAADKPGRSPLMDVSPPSIDDEDNFEDEEDFYDETIDFDEV